MDILKHHHPIARKEHICDFCGQTIKVGEQYDAMTILDGDFYTWKSHTECSEVASLLKMYDKCGGDGVTSDEFEMFIDDYVCKKHTDHIAHDIEDGWKGKSYYEYANMIIAEMKTKTI